MNKGIKIEELSGDMLNDDFIQIFQPMFVVLRILGLLRVNINYRYPTAPTTLYHLYSNAFWILNTVCVIYYLLYCDNAFDSLYAVYTLKFSVIMNGINGVLIVCRNNIYRGNKVSQMYVKLQKIERYLNMRETESSNKQLSRRATIIIVSACLSTIMWLILFNIVFMKKTCIPLMLILTTGAGIHIEMAQVYFIIYLIKIRVNYINNALQQNSPTIKPFRKSIGHGKLFIIMNSSEKSDEKASGGMVSAMQGILEALSELTELFQFSIFCFICQIFAWNLVSIKNLVTSLKEQKTADFDLMLCAIPRLLFMQIIMLLLCCKIESLSSKLGKTRKLCIDIISYSDGKSRDQAKQLLLLVEGRRSVCIYNIFTLGTRLPLHLLAVTASYTTVLLQFALL